eukprot:3762614-Rhodomonas_salina.1
MSAASCSTTIAPRLRRELLRWPVDVASTPRRAPWIPKSDRSLALDDMSGTHSCRVGAQASYASGRSYDPEASYITADPSFDPTRSSLSPDRTTPKTSPPTGVPAKGGAGSPTRNAGGRPASGAGWEASLDPERASFASEMSFDPEASSYGGVGGRSGGERESIARLAAMRSEPSIDPEASSYSLAAPFRAAAAAHEPSFDPESRSSEVSFDPEAMGGHRRGGSEASSQRSFDPEARMSEPSFDPEHRMMGDEKSFDPERDSGA